jgi:hypothetical protein
LHWRVGDQCRCTYVADGQEVCRPDNSISQPSFDSYLSNENLHSKIPSTRRRLTA